MRKTIFVGLLLAATTVVTVFVGETLDLEIAPVVLLGAAIGAVVALVPDQSAGRRLAAYLLGFLAGLVGYFFRAALMPDTAAGRAIAAGFVVLLCVGIVALAMGRLPMWGTLLGAASLVGAFEHTYSEAPPRVLDTSVSTSTALLLCVAVGFLVVSLLVGAEAAEKAPARDADEARLDDMMEAGK